jgi:hypothetical protein
VVRADLDERRRAAWHFCLVFTRAVYTHRHRSRANTNRGGKAHRPYRNRSNFRFFEEPRRWRKRTDGEKPSLPGRVDGDLIPEQWDQLVRVAASLN